MNLNDLDTFMRVAANGSFAGAARELEVPKSTVSRRVQRLEDELDSALVVRGSRRLTLTDLGLQLSQRAGPPLREIQEAERALVSDEPRGVLRLTAPNDLGTSVWFTQLLAGFRLKYPQVTLDLDLTARIVDLVEEGFDAAFRPVQARAPRSDELMTRRFRSSVDAQIYASDEYLARNGRPRRVEDLADHDAVTIPVLASGWPLERGKETAVGRPRVVATARDFQFVVAACRAGMGLALLPEIYARARDLTTVLSKWRTKPLQIALVWPRARHLTPRLRAFLDYVPLDQDVFG